MRKTSDADLSDVAKILRTAADLIERKVIDEFEIRIDWGTRDEPDPKTHGYTMHHIHTGEKTLTVKMEIGHLKSPEFDISPLIQQPRAALPAKKG